MTPRRGRPVMPRRGRPITPGRTSPRALWRDPGFGVFLTAQTLGDGVVGLVLAVAAFGTVGGALAVAPLRRRLGFGRCWTGAVLLCGLATAGLGASGSVPAAAVLAAAYLGCASVAGICSMSLRQEVTPDYLLGRVTAAFWTITSR
ncbi:MAG: hypothetical protein ACLP5E_25005 [Streptosporangiaceae bacterium]